jgi:hypothetical protein
MVACVFVFRKRLPSTLAEWVGVPQPHYFYTVTSLVFPICSVKLYFQGGIPYLEHFFPSWHDTNVVTNYSTKFGPFPAKDLTSLQT